MNILSLNICGTGSEKKREKLRFILNKHRVNFLSIQESMMSKSDTFRIKSLWGNFGFEFLELLAIGHSGGLLSIWDPRAFIKEEEYIRDRFIVVKGKWVSHNLECYMVNVYAPQQETEKTILWQSLLNFMAEHAGNFIICGDFNSVRGPDERMGTSFSKINATNFNIFLENSNLVDLYLGRHKFTRTNIDGTKASRIDRFLVNQEIIDSIPDLNLVALDDILSDHRPLLLSQLKLDFGPSPFKFYNTWLDLDGFDNVMLNSWKNQDGINDKGAFINLKDKLKRLKNDIKSWRKENGEKRNKEVISKELAEVDNLLILDRNNNNLAEKRRALVTELQVMDFRHTNDLKQKAKIKWCIEGDENSKFFHAYINKRRRENSLRGIKHNGTWITDANGIKSCFRQHFANKFKRFDGLDFKVDDSLFSKLSDSQAINLEAEFSMEEVKTAVWSCGGDKAPGPDGFSFAMIKRKWSVLKEDILKMTNDFYQRAYIPVGCNSSFITLIPKVSNPTIVSDFRPISLIGVQYKIIAKLLALRLAKVIDKVVSPVQTAFIKGRQILDGPLLLNETIDWYKRRRKKLMLFKIDFAKAYDSLSWDYLFSILQAMGFGSKWISWIKACLTSARSSVLVNGSPTEEFPIQRGLRQGDPMAPFLFIIAMEGLHIAINNLVKGNKFKCANINRVRVSHLFFADDVMLVGEGNARNMEVIAKALRFFHCISGLKINFDKSSIINIGMDDAEVHQLATSVGCKVESFPFKYLGIPIGGSSARISTWEPIISKFQKRLSNWKAGMLSIGGRSTLISSVLGSLGIYYLSIFRMPKKVNNILESLRSSFFWGGTKNNRKISWVKWGSILAAKDDGGVGFGSLEGMNHALLYRWRWRAFNNPNSLWVRVITAIHGEDCFLNLSSKNRGLWQRIGDSAKILHEIPSFSHNVITRKIGNGHNTKFWTDVWCGESTFASLFPRLYALESQKDCTVSSRRGSSCWEWRWNRPIRSSREVTMIQQLVDNLPSNIISQDDDRWVWCLDGKSEFSIAQIRHCFDHHSLPISNMKTKWSKLVPKKVNLFVWRLRRDALPTTINLFARGIDITSVRCMNCDNGTELFDHVFQQCKLVKDTRSLLSKWLKLDIPDDLPNRILSWCDNLHILAANRYKVEAILFTWWWLIWKARNNALHNDIHESGKEIFHSITSFSYLWIKSRDKKASIAWDSWIVTPFSN